MSKAITLAQLELHALKSANYTDGKVNELRNDVADAIEEVSAEIEEIATDGVPDYVTEEAEATIAKVFSHGNFGRTIRFIAISDTHEDSEGSYNPQITISNKHAGQAIKYIADRIGLDFVAHLGDASSCGAFTTTYEYDVLCNDVKNINKFVFSGVRGIKTAFIPGNHDMTSANGVSLLNSGAYILFGNLCSGNKDRLGGYGFFDIDDAKVRVIYLNTSDSPTSAAYLALTQEQKNWLCETLIDVNTKDNADEWKIILLSHAPLDFGGANISTDILLPYVNGGSYNAYSFADKNNAKIISNIHGHVHCFSYGYIGDKIRRFTIPNACFVGANHYAGRTEYAAWTDTTTYNKTANSGKDTAFSLVTIDLDSGMCYVDNYGAGIDREFSTEYNVTKVIVNEILTSVDTDETTIYNGTGYALNTRLGSDGTTRANAANCVTSGLIPYNGQDVELVIPTVSPGSYAYFHLMTYDSGTLIAIAPFTLPNGTSVDGSRRQIKYWISDWGVTSRVEGSTTILTIPATIIDQARHNTPVPYLRVSSNIDSGVTIGDSTFRVSFL